MELKRLFKAIAKNKKTVLRYGLLGLVVGIIAYAWPAKYLTTGSFYVKRGVDASNEFFTYEGYYAQQAALAYTNTVIALFESVDIHSSALANTGVPVNEKTLHQTGRNTKVKKSGPQIVTLTVTGNRESDSKILWESLAQETTQAISRINSNGDYRLGLSAVSAEPVTKKQYKSPLVYIPASILLGLGLGIFINSLKEYEA
jgi:capsular polysaccharide biosynthesis protein